MAKLVMTSVVLFSLFALIHSCHSLDYSDLEVLGLNCPDQDKCEKYKFDKKYTERSCECDYACVRYGDCCIDERRRSDASTVRTGMKCVNIGVSPYTGVYAIANCSKSWRGSPQIREKCEGPMDFNDPLLAAPVTSTSHGITYRNRFCAECNNAVMTSLKLFQIKLSCNGLHSISDDQILADMKYSQQYHAWGVNRINSRNKTSFHSCEIMFDAPPYLNKRLRFCRANLVSTCDSSWVRNSIRRKCADYMAVVYDSNNVAYRNPHCAICNGRSLDEIVCKAAIFGSRRSAPVSFSLLIDVNLSDGDKVGITRLSTPQCPSSQIYDPFFKRCKCLASALPGATLVDGICVRI